MGIYNMQQTVPGRYAEKTKRVVLPQRQLKDRDTSLPLSYTASSLALYTPAFLPFCPSKGTKLFLAPVFPLLFLLLVAKVSSGLSPVPEKPPPPQYHSASFRALKSSCLFMVFSSHENESSLRGAPGRSPLPCDQGLIESRWPPV